MAFIRAEWEDLMDDNPNRKFRAVTSKFRAVTIDRAYRVSNSGQILSNFYVNEIEAEELCLGEREQASAVYKVINNRYYNLKHYPAILVSMTRDKKLIKDISNLVICASGGGDVSRLIDPDLRGRLTHKGIASLYQTLTEEFERAYEIVKMRDQVSERTDLNEKNRRKLK